MSLEDVVVPPIFPDTEETRSDLTDYFYEVELFDTEAGRLIGTIQYEFLKSDSNLLNYDYSNHKVSTMVSYRWGL